MKYPSHVKYSTEQNRVKKHKRRARELGLPHDLTFSQWMSVFQHYKWCCAFCKTKERLTLEHLLPLRMGGGTTADNCVPACDDCNHGLHVSAANGVN